MATRKKYRILVKWKHRKFGPQHHRTAAEGTSIRRAINNALLSFFSDSNAGPHARRDAHAMIQVEATRTKEKPDR